MKIYGEHRGLKALHQQRHVPAWSSCTLIDLQPHPHHGATAVSTHDGSRATLVGAVNSAWFGLFMTVCVGEGLGGGGSGLPKAQPGC